MNGSINARFALNPESIASEDDVYLALNRMGLDRGRLLAAFPESWEKSLIQHSKTLSTRTQALIEIELNRLQGQLLPVGLRYDSSKNWDLNAIIQLSIGNLSAAISSDGAPPPLTSLKSLTEDSLESISPRSAHMKASVESYIKTLQPLLMTSQRINYIDPYFDLTRSHYLKTFSALLDSAKLTKARNWAVYTRHLVKSSMLEKDEEKNKIALEAILPSGHSFCINFLDDSLSSEKLHQRVVFTKHSGFEFQIGLQHRPKDIYPISHIPTSLRDSLNRLFVHGEHNFRKRRSLVIEK